MKDMAEQDSKQITVLIAGRPYPLKIKSSDEAVIRKIVKEVNEKVHRFQLTYPNRDKQDCLALALLAYAVDHHKANQSATQQKRLSDKLIQLDLLLDRIVSDS